MSMDTTVKKEKNTRMYVCLVAAVLAVMKMYTGSNIYLVMFTIMIAFAILMDKMENKIFYIIFFSTWAYVLKFDPKSYSMFLFLSVEYCALGIYNLFKSGKSYNMKLWFVLIVFLAYSFVISAFSSSNINTILGVLINYLTCALALMFFSDPENLKKWMWAFVVGMLIQSIVSFLALESFGQVGEYLSSLREHAVITSSGVMSRFAGFEKDPNYFSAEALVAICSLLIYMVYEKKLLVPTIAIGFLALVGLLTLSKMYLMCLIILIVIAVVSTFRYKTSSGFVMLVAFGVVAAIIWKNFGEDILAGFYARLDNVDSVSGLTTGRTGTWKAYLGEIFGNFKVFFLGAGVGSGFVESKAAHNGFLSLLYFWGVVGSALFISLLKELDNIIANKVSVEKKNFFNLRNITFIILLLTNFALDCVLMDFFPIAVFLVVINRYYGYEKEEIEESGLGTE